MNDVHLIRFLTDFYALKRRLRFVALAMLFAANLTVLFFVESSVWRAVLIVGMGLLALLVGRAIHRLEPRSVARDIADRLSGPLH